MTLRLQNMTNFQFMKKYTDTQQLFSYNSRTGLNAVC